MLGGALGSLIRYGVSGCFTTKSCNPEFPLGTLYVNLAGCLLIGIVFGLCETRGVSPHFRLFFMTGFLGALTTFSAYGLETMTSAEGGLLNVAIFNVAANNIGGLALVKAGLLLARFF